MDSPNLLLLLLPTSSSGIDRDAQEHVTKPLSLLNRRPAQTFSLLQHNLPARRTEEVAQSQSNAEDQLPDPKHSKCQGRDRHSAD